MMIMPVKDTYCGVLSHASVFCTLLIFLDILRFDQTGHACLFFVVVVLVKSFQHNLHLANEIRACSWSCVIREKLSERKNPVIENSVFVSPTK